MLNKRYDCELETAGYRICVAVFTANRSEVESLARRKALERLKQVYGLERTDDELKLISVQEKIPFR